MEISPRRSIGPIQIGMHRENLNSTGLQIKQQNNSPDNLLVGPLMVTINNNVVTQISAQPKYMQDRCLVFEGKEARSMLP